MPKISACIVAYCDYEEVCAAVRSILQHTPAPDFALYVVDNGSPDGCGQRLAETDFGDARVTVLPLAQEGWCSIHAVICESQLWERIERLKALGAEGILVLTLENMIR